MIKSFWLISLVLVVLAQPGFSEDVLQQVVIVTRHGVRSPTWTPERLNQYSATPWTDFGVPPGYLTPRGRDLMKMMGGFYHDFYSNSLLKDMQSCDNAKRVYFWADTDQRTLETARALTESILPACKIEVNSKPSGVSDPLFNAIETGVAKPDYNLSIAAVQGRVGPKLDVLQDTYRAEFQSLQNVLNGNGKAQKSIFDDRLLLA